MARTAALSPLAFWARACLAPVARVMSPMAGGEFRDRGTWLSVAPPGLGEWVPFLARPEEVRPGHIPIFGWPGYRPPSAGPTTTFGAG
jgi:hypothetical protein